MQGDLIVEKYSDNEKYRYEIYNFGKNLYRVWLQRLVIDSYSDDDGNFYEDEIYVDMSGYAHIVDTLERAIELGDEAINSFNGIRNDD